MINFLDMPKEELGKYFESLGEKKFRAKQCLAWIYRGARDFSEMTDLSSSLRAKLEELCAAGEIATGIPKKIDSRRSADGSTEKFLFELSDGNAVETVLMRYKYGNSVCVSSQAGCRMGCRFCASTIGGRERDLTAGEILGQVIAACPEGERIGHIVIMGTGEPFDNYENVSAFIRMTNDPDGLDIGLRNITVSTCGIVPGIYRFTDDFPQVNLAVSLHASDDASRSRIMPVNDSYPLGLLMPACAEYTEKTGRRITFEYALTKGVNDSTESAAALAGLIKKYIRGRLSHVNIIPLNAVKETGLSGSSRETAEKFRETLELSGIAATVRREMGADIDAACGQLRLGNKSSKCTI